MAGLKEQFEQMKAQCPYCMIVSKKLESNIIWEDEHCTVFLDIRPATKGHMTIIPNEHYSLFSATPPKILNHMFSVAHRIIEITKKAMARTSYNVFIPVGGAAGQMVQHAAIQLMPVDDNEYIDKFDFETKEIDSNKWQESHNKFKQIYPLMIGNIGKQKEPIPMDQLIKIIKENPQILEMYNNDNEGFKIQVNVLNAQLRGLFEGHDIDEVMRKANE